MELSDNITSVTTSYAKLTKLSKKRCHLACQAEQTSYIYLPGKPGCSVLGWSIEGMFFHDNNIFQ